MTLCSKCNVTETRSFIVDENGQHPVCDPCMDDMLDATESTEVESDDYEPTYLDDYSDDGEALASAGMGTDEDYGYYGGDDDY